MTTRFQGIGVVVSYNTQTSGVVLPSNPNPIISSSLERFNTATLSWTELKSMNSPRCGFAMHSINDYLYAFGGTDGAEVHKSTEEYDIFSNTWTNKTSMPTPRAFFMSVEHDAYIYCIGGLTSDGTGSTTVTNNVDRYDTINDEWETLAPLPTGFAVMMGVAHYKNGKIFVLSGCMNSIGTCLDHVLIYNVNANTWSFGNSLTTDQQNLYQRALPFSFIDDDYIYVVNGLYYSQPQPIKDSNGNIISQPDPISEYLPDAYKYQISTDTIFRGEDGFVELPRPRYAGCTTNVGNKQYYMGGVSSISTTLRFVETSDISVSPFPYDDLTRMITGRSSFAASPYDGDYGEAIFVAGGVANSQNPNFLSVDVTAVPTSVRLDGKETCNVVINVYDENGEAPEKVLIRLTATGGDDDIVLFTFDQVEVYNGHAIATMLPRCDDAFAGISMQDNTVTSYNIVISGSVIDSTYYGDTVPSTSSTTTSSGGTTSVPDTTANVSLPKQYDTSTVTTVTNAGQASQGTYFNSTISSIGFIDLQPTVSSGGQSATVNFYSDIPWMPQIIDVLDTNDGTYAEVLDAIDRMSRQNVFGGSPLFDSLSESVNIMQFDVTGNPKLIYVLTDGEENCSENSASDILNQVNALNGIGKTPIISSQFKIVPSDLYLDQGIRGGSTQLENLAAQTNASSLYVVSDEDIDEEVSAILAAKGFLGYGTYSFQYDFGQETLIQSILLNFDIEDPLTSAYWQYSIGDENGVFNLFTDRFEVNETITLLSVHGRYIKFLVTFSATLIWNEYIIEQIIPPKLVSIDIVYHQSTDSYIYLNPITTTEDLSQIVITLDATRPSGSEIALGVNSSLTGTWEDYYSPAAPAVENNSRIVIPIRKSLDGNLYTLELLISVDGFIFDATYGKWSNDSTVVIYEDGTTVVPADEYTLFPEKGRVVFAYKTQKSYSISIQNKQQFSVAAKITNKVHGDPVKIYGLGFMYSTLAATAGANDSILPSATNLLITPLQPTRDSVFRGTYSYYDLLGRQEDLPSNGGTIVTWYINNVIAADIQNVVQWDNDKYTLVEAGDSIYFTVQPATNQNGQIIIGAKVRSLPVTIG